MRSIGPIGHETWRAFASGPPRAAGFSLIELVIAIAIIGILLVIGMPSLSGQIASAKVNSMADFYLDGLRIARNGAQQKSGAARFVLTANPNNGQRNWQVDWCFPTSVAPCDAGGNWSTTAAAAAGDINVANPSLSVFRSADSLPPSSNMALTLTPGDALAVYFNAQGWINTGVQPFLRQLRVDPAAQYNPDPAKPNVRPVAVGINLSGVAERCDPLAAAADSRACSP